MNKWVHYVILLFTAECFIGIQSSYSIAKQNIGDEFNITEEKFGVYEMINMAGRFFGVIIVLVAPIKKIKLTYLVFLCIQVLAYMMICAGHYLPEAVPIFFPISMFLIGSGAGIFTFPYLLLIRCFKTYDLEHEGQQKDHKTAFNIWFGLMLLGHAPALLLGKWIIDDLGLHWIISLFTFDMIYLLTGILVCILVPQSLLMEEGEEEKTIGRKICEMMETLGQYLKRNISNVILIFQYCFIDNQPIMVVYWVPFFFMKSGFGFLATWIAVSYPIGVCLGSFTMTPLVGAFPTRAPILTTLFLLIQAICFLCFWFIELEEENFGKFIALLGIASIFIIAPYSRAGQTDVLERTTSHKEKYMAVNFMRMCTEILSSLLMLSVGFLMQIEIKNFLFVLTITPFIALMLHIVRRLRENKEKKMIEPKKQKNQQRNQNNNQGNQETRPPSQNQSALNEFIQPSCSVENQSRQELNYNSIPSLNLVNRESNK